MAKTSKTPSTTAPKTTRAPHAGPPPAAAHNPGPAAEPEPEEVPPTAISAEDRDLLQRASIFLFQIQYFAARARAQGYDDAEHALGWSLYIKASGRDRPLSHWIAEGEEVGGPAKFTAEQTRLLGEIDQFENLWFPRIRGILQRAIPEDRFEQFNAAFFKDLSQQPLGPTVLDSVSTLLARFEELKHSEEPGAKEAFELGTKRGLTPQKIAGVRELIETARTSLPSKEASPKVSPKVLAKAREEQLAAVKDLRRWYNDWAATFRTVFGPRAQIRLGLMTLKRDEPSPPIQPPAIQGGADK